MWTLECDGDSLAHKKIWLRPGKKYLFGRTKEQKGLHAGFKIDHKSVSRQHLTLSVSKVRPGDGSSVNKRSEVTLTDENTKFKTEIDGESIKNESRILKKDEQVFRLGNSTQKFFLKWQPVVFTFSLTSKELKAGKDPLANQRNRLEDLDVKTIIPYIIESTTHVVAGKRNTAKGLQALINSKHIVAESFIDALIYATTPTDLDVEESLSPLEEDFDANWPNPADHLPAKSKEPSERPAIDFVPNADRARVFEGYTFVFLEQLQFETLHAPITNGGGKALYRALEPGKTTSEDTVRYVKSVAGEKGLGEFEDGSEGKGVVVVKFRNKENPEWAAEMDYQVAQALDHRLIEQSEFLDAILNNNASMLRRPLLPDDDEAPGTHRGFAPATGVQATEKPAEKPVEPEVAQPPPRRRARGPIVSRFKGFDDDDDNKYPLPDSSRPAPDDSHMSNLPNGLSHHHSNGASFAHENSMEVDPTSQMNGDVPLNPRKRRAPSSDIEGEEDLVDKLLPATTALKKRRLEDEAEAERAGVPLNDSPSPPVSPPKPAKKPKPKQVNVREVARARRQAEDEAAQRDEEENLHGLDVSGMKNLAIVEEMQLPSRPSKTATNHPDNENNTPRWDPHWNGRKNFKRFRRRGDGTAPLGRRGQSVIVPLEEVKKKDFGIGDEYWLERERDDDSTTTRKRKRGDREHTTHSQLRTTPFTTARTQTATVPANLVDDGADVPDVIDVDAPRMTRNADHRSKDTQNTNTGSGRRPQAQAVKAGKRAPVPAAAAAAPPPVPVLVKIAGPKKRKRFKAARDSECDSSEEEEEGEERNEGGRFGRAKRVR